MWLWFQTFFERIKILSWNNKNVRGNNLIIFLNVKLIHLTCKSQLNQATRFIQQKIHQVIPLVLLLCKLPLLYWISMPFLIDPFVLKVQSKEMCRREETNHVFIFKPVQAHLVLLCFPDVVFYKLKVCGKAMSSKSIGTIFPTAFVHFVSLCHISASLTIFQTFSLLLYLLC